MLYVCFVFFGLFGRGPKRGRGKPRPFRRAVCGIRGSCRPEVVRSAARRGLAAKDIFWQLVIQKAVKESQLGR